MTGQPPMGASPVSVPSGNPGDMAMAMSEVRQALEILTRNLPKLQIGSDPYKAVLDTIKKLSGTFPASQADPGVQKTTLAGLAKDADSSIMMQSLMRSMGQGGGAPSMGAGQAAGATA